MAVRQRTADVLGDTGSFADLLLPDHILQGLQAAGFTKPSPVQKAAIPLGRVGADLVVQAKSGTGKTLVFGVICLEKVDLEVTTPQVLILAPTREIALQSAQVIQQIAAELPGQGLAVGVFIGGMPTEEDRKLLRRRCHIAIGTPGRIGALLEQGTLPSERLRTLVLDEADCLLSDSFQADVKWVAEVLPKRKQVLAFSATFSPALLAVVEGLMRRPQRVMLCPDTVSLLGVHQFYAPLPEGLEGGALLEAKVEALLQLMSSITFHQAVVFCNARADAQRVVGAVAGAGFPAAWLSAGRPQVERMDTLAALRNFKLRVIVSTDLVARGVDLERVNLVANLDLPHDAATYMHRVGRTGRFGTHGIAVTFVAGEELDLLQAYLQDVAGGTVELLPEVITEDMYQAELSSQDEQDAFQALLQAPPSASSPAGADADQPRAANGATAMPSWAADPWAALNGDGAGTGLWGGPAAAEPGSATEEPAADGSSNGWYSSQLRPSGEALVWQRQASTESNGPEAYSEDEGGELPDVGGAADQGNAANGRLQLHGDGRAGMSGAGQGHDAPSGTISSSIPATNSIKPPQNGHAAAASGPSPSQTTPASHFADRDRLQLPYPAPTPADHVIHEALPCAAAATPGAAPAPPPAPPVHPQLQSHLPQLPASAGSSRAHPAAAGGEQAERMVSVPLSLLRRYQQLEEEDWRRRYRQWEWDLHNYYSFYYPEYYTESQQQGSDQQQA